ncbi:MAG: glycosyltransferase family 1 protein [Nitrospirae bacterium]|nr:MAG: glycosyltransferase family 1 protein [Nitrospirota bacterium]
MRILHVVEAFGGGVFDFLLALTKGTPGYEHVIMHGLRSETVEGFRELFPDNVRFHLWKHATREIRPWKDISAFIELISILKKDNDSSVIHLHSSKAGFLGRLAARLLGIEKRVIYTTHSIAFLRKDIGAIKRRLFISLERAGAGFGGKVIACSRSELDIMESHGIKGEFIYNGVQDCYVSTARSKKYWSSDIKSASLEPLSLNSKHKEIDSGDIVIGTVGRITEQKNPDLFNSIAEAFIGEDILRFIWVGDGRLRQRLVSPNIEVTGWVDTERVDDYILDMDIYISTSMWEGLPLSAVRAMCLKKPLVLSDCSGNIDLVREGQNGYLFSNIEEGVRCLERLAGDQEMREKMGEASRTLYKEFFTVEQMVERYVRVYKEVAAGHQ